VTGTAFPTTFGALFCAQFSHSAPKVVRKPGAAAEEEPGMKRAFAS
jgi:hypothetical protein